MSNYIERYWRDARPEDAIKEPPMVARFRHEVWDDWEYDYLVGWDRTDDDKWRGNLRSFLTCQVYDAPDPGEGWRLIDVEKEQPQVGDGVFDKVMNLWIERPHVAPFEKNFTYRRRIEQPKPAPQYVPFTWDDREQLRGRWIVDSDGDEHCIIRLEQYQEVFLINGNPADEAIEDWNFADTGEPVGRRTSDGGH